MLFLLRLRGVSHFGLSPNLEFWFPNINAISCRLLCFCGEETSIPRLKLHFLGTKSDSFGLLYGVSGDLVLWYECYTWKARAGAMWKSAKCSSCSFCCQFCVRSPNSWSLYLTGKVKEKKASEESIHGSSSAALSTFIWQNLPKDILDTVSCPQTHTKSKELKKKKRKKPTPGFNKWTDFKVETRLERGRVVWVPNHHPRRRTSLQSTTAASLFHVPPFSPPPLLFSHSPSFSLMGVT